MEKIGLITRSAEGDHHHTSSDVSLFSSSLPVLLHEKFHMDDSDTGNQLAGSSNKAKIQADSECNDAPDVESQEIAILLPDDEEELLAGIIDDLDLCKLPSSVEELEDCDFFASGGGMELEMDPHESMNFGMPNVSMYDHAFGNEIIPCGPQYGVGTIVGEHPFGEHPSRTLFVRNINSSVEDSELRALFEQYGDIRTMYTACKHRGFVMISYYDIRAARTAMRALQNKPLRRRKLDIHFSIPKDNPSDKDINQGTLVIFNLDLSVSNDDLQHIFGAYGEVKEIRETPHKRHHKFIEFYDVRAAEAALKSLNRSDIAGKRIKLEPSRPGGARRNLFLQLNQDIEQVETRDLRYSALSPSAGSPPGNWLDNCSPIERSPSHGVTRSAVCSVIGSSPTSHFSGLACAMSNTTEAQTGKEQSSSHLGNTSMGLNSSYATNYEHSYPFSGSNLCHSNTSLTSYGTPNSVGQINEAISGKNFFLRKHSPHSEPFTSTWPMSPMTNIHPSASHVKSYGFPHAELPNVLFPSHSHLRVMSAPSRVPSERHVGFFPESPMPSLTHSAGCNTGYTSLDGNFGTKLVTCTNPTSSFSSNIFDKGSSIYGMAQSSRISPVHMRSSPYTGVPHNNLDGFVHYAQLRRLDGSENSESKKLFHLDLNKIISGEDARTTLMIKNIPNKYTSKMLLAAIDEKHRGTYDFFYLPIDFKNKCNVGYAFINMLSPSQIIPFYEAFNGKKWEKFNSEKVASIAYARIQGKAALVAHFQNSSLMNEDKRCRPILFKSDSDDAVGQVPGEQLSSRSITIPPCQNQSLFSHEFPVAHSEDPDVKSTVG